MTIPKLLCPSYGKGQILVLKLPNFFLRGRKWSKISIKKFHSKTVMRPIKLISGVLNAKMYVVGQKSLFFFSRVNSGENGPKLAGQISSSSFHHPHPPPPLSSSLLVR